MKIAAVILALVFILVVAGTAAAESEDRLVAPPLNEALPTEISSPMPFKGSEMAPVYQIGDKTRPQNCPVPWSGLEIECPLEGAASIY